MLLIDDYLESRRNLAKVLMAHRFSVVEVETGASPIDALRRSRIQAAIVDTRLTSPGGLSILTALLREQPGLPVIVVAADGTMDSAVRAMKAGARDVFAKPLPISRLLAELSECARRAESSGRVPAPASRATREMEKLNIIGHSRAMLELFDTIKRIAPRASRILITGESGTGKELVARALHDLGARSAGPFIAINCATLSDQILESELFGHERGAFTSADQLKMGVMEVAHGGTLFLDEINEMGAACQAKMLRVLESKEFRRVGGTKKIKVDFNLIAATNADLERWVAEGRFRSDLYYRLKVVTLEVPALRNRKEAIPVLAARFLADIARDLDAEPKTLTADALAALERYHWPGNVRELHNCIEGVTLTARRAVVDVTDLPAAIRGAGPTEIRIAVGTRLEDAERELLRHTLQACASIKEAAATLGIGERTVYTKMKAFGFCPRAGAPRAAQEPGGKRRARRGRT